MRREVRDIWAAEIDAAGRVVAYGHFGRPVLAFPAEQGGAFDFEANGMVAGISDLIDAGRVKLYCVDSYDAASWSNREISTEERAHRHGHYEAWILDRVVPWIYEDCGGPLDLTTTGVSLGAFHALNFSLKRADLFPLALCLSGSYDPGRWHGWGDRGDATYFNSPIDYVRHLHGDHLEWLRSRLSVLLVVGQGAWETVPTGALPSTLQMAELLRAKQIPCELDLWGHDVAHDWPWWRRQLAHHLQRIT